MKRTLIIVLVVLPSIALFAGLVHLVLVAANLSEPAATTVMGVTPGRVWATIAAFIGLLGVVVGGLALRRAVQSIEPGHGRKGAIVAVVAGLIAVLNGGLNLAVATGGPGTGNGVVGAAGALVLGLIAAGVGVLALARSRSRRAKRRDEMAEQKMFANDRRFRERAAMTKRSESAKMPMNYDIPVEWDRRTFLQGLGFAVLAVQSLALSGCESGDPPIDDKMAVDNLIMHSSPGKFDHVHDLLIPYALLRTPPSEGVKLLSTKSFFHRHEIALTQEELTTVNQGGSVTRKASSHLFIIALAK